MIEKVLIVGAGAMGCLFAARMSLAGIDTTLVDVDADRLALIRRDGLHLVDNEGVRTATMKAELAINVTEPPDLIVLFTKGMHTLAATSSVAHLASADPVVLTLQNGVGNAELIAEAFAPESIVVGTAHVPADLEGPNTVISKGFAHLAIGNFTHAQGGRAEAVLDLLVQSGFETETKTDIENAIWEKLTFNAALNALAMVTGSRNADLDNAPAKGIAKQIASEAIAVFSARGGQLDDVAIWRTVEHALEQHAHHKASMLQDREAGRPTEIDFINGAIVREGSRLGIHTPANAILCDLVKIIELREAQP